MCDKGYDLDCLDGIESAPGADSKSACGGAVGPQVIPTHNNNRRAPGQTITTTTSAGSMSWRSENLLTCMLITANVGTIFEESTLLELWFEQLKSYLIKIKPHLVAIHCQEVGGKNYETSMKNVSSFTDKILGDDKVVGDYSRVRIFLDENFECLEKFTALGSLYLVHDSVDNVKLYNFKTAQYDTVEGRRILAAPDKRDLTLEQTTGPERGTDSAQQQQASGSSADVAEHVEKIKFPQELFPECRWSRKGFMRTRWLFNDCQPLDLVNIHLFHDASNLVAMKTTPSPYAQNRQKALEFALRKISEPLQVVNNNNNNSSSTNNNNNNNNSSNNNNNNNNRGQVSQNLITKSSQPAIQEQQAGDCSATTIEQHEQNQVPMFIFGDFNFRLNTSKVIQRITEGTSPVVKKNANSDEVLEIVYHRKTSDCAREGPVCNECDEQEAAATSNNTNALSSENNGIAGADETGECGEEGGVLMTLGKKLFDYRNLDETFRATKNTEWLLELDNELDSFKRQLYEFKISFKPSYPFKEDHSGGYSYMKTRCPAWCDRILFNETGYRLIKMAGAEPVGESGAADMQAAPTNPDSEKRIELLQNQGDVIYRLMGSSVPMGDHKPVLLYCHLNISLKQDQQQQLQSQQNPSSKCNRTVMSASAAASITPPTQIEDNMVESTAM